MIGAYHNVKTNRPPVFVEIIRNDKERAALRAPAVIPWKDVTEFHRLQDERKMFSAHAARVTGRSPGGGGKSNALR